MSPKAIVGTFLGIVIGGTLLVGLFLFASMSIYSSTQRQAFDNACCSNLRAVDAAVLKYITENKLDPNMSDLVNEHYLDKIPQCPSGTHYFLQDKGQKRHAVCPRGHKYRND